MIVAPSSEYNGSLDLLPYLNTARGELIPQGPESNTVTDPDSVTTSADLGSIPSGLANLGMDLAGVPGPIQSGVNAALGSTSFDQLQDSLLSSLASNLASTAVNAALPGLPGLPSMAGALAGESTKKDSNYSAAALSSGINTGAALLGTAVAGPLGGMLAGSLAGYAVKSSLRDGWLGDLADSRTSEAKRDAVEDSFGFDPSDTAGMASTQQGMDALGITDKGLGLDAAYGSTTAGQLASSAKQAGFDDSSLMGYLDRLDKLSREFDTTPAITKTSGLNSLGNNDGTPGNSGYAGGFRGDADIDSRDRHDSAYDDDNDDGGNSGGNSGGATAGNAGGARGGGSEGNSGYW